MKKTLATLLCSLVLLSGLDANAADDTKFDIPDPSKKSEKEKNQAQIQVQAIGGGWVVGPNGQKVQFKINGKDIQPVGNQLDELKKQIEKLGGKLPEGVKKQLDEAMKKAGANGNVKAHAIIIGPNGNVQQFNGNNQNEQIKKALDKAMKDLPADIRKQLEGKLNEVFKPGNNNGIQLKVEVNGEEVKEVPADVKKKFEEARRQAEEARKKIEAQVKKNQDQFKQAFQFNAGGNGKIMIVTPDGVKKEFNLNGNLGENKELLNQFRIQIGDAQKKALEQAKAAASKVAPSKAPAKKPSSIEKKLDLILNRLEKLEDEVKELKKED